MKWKKECKGHVSAPPLQVDPRFGLFLWKKSTKQKIDFFHFLFTKTRRVMSVPKRCNPCSLSHAHTTLSLSTSLPFCPPLLHTHTHTHKISFFLHLFLTRTYTISLPTPQSIHILQTHTLFLSPSHSLLLFLRHFLSHTHTHTHTFTHTQTRTFTTYTLSLSRFFFSDWTWVKEP